MTNTAPHILSLTFLEDSAHGWLAVDMAHLRDLGIAERVTAYSYRDGDIAYLEEDEDSVLFYEAAMAAGYELCVDRVCISGLCFVRDLPRFGVAAPLGEHH